MAKTTESNGSKNIWELVRLLVVLGLASIAAVAGYGQLRERLQANITEDVKVHADVPKNTLALAGVKKDIEQIQKDVSRVDAKLGAQVEVQSEILRVQQQILREIQMP